MTGSVPKPRLGHVDVVILSRVYERPSWARSLQAVLPRVKLLVSAGLVERCRPPTGGANNMIRITDKGIDAIEAHWASERGRT